MNVLCFHWIFSDYNPTGEFKAIAILPENFTSEDIMKLANFRNHSDFDKAIAEKIAAHKYCALFYGPHGNEFGKDENDIRYQVGEYIVITPKENGDLRLHEFMWTGYCDIPENHKHDAVWWVDFQNKNE